MLPYSFNLGALTHSSTVPSFTTNHQHLITRALGTPLHPKKFVVVHICRRISTFEPFEVEQCVRLRSVPAHHPWIMVIRPCAQAGGLASHRKRWFHIDDVELGNGNDSFGF